MIYCHSTTSDISRFLHKSPSTLNCFRFSFFLAIKHTPRKLGPTHPIMSSSAKGDYVIQIPKSLHTDTDSKSFAGYSSLVPSSRPGNASTGPDRTENSSVLSIVAYCLSSISMTVVNKYVVSGSSWNLTFFYLAIQTIVSTTAIVAAKKLQLLNTLAPLDAAKAKKCTVACSLSCYKN